MFWKSDTYGCSFLEESCTLSFFFLMSFVAWIFHGWSKQILGNIPVLKRCTEIDETGKQVACYGTLAIYRISFVLAVFHIILALVMIGVKHRGDFRNSIQDGWWLIKLIFLVGGTIGCFFIPNPFFEYYGWFALAFSAFFIIIQLLLLVDFAHNWAEHWIGKMEESEDGDRTWFALLLSSTIGLLLVSVILTIIMSIFFCKDASDCQRNVAAVTVNTILCVAICFVSIHPKVQEANPKSGLLQAAVIAAYSTYLIFSSMLSSTDSCNPWPTSSKASNSSVAIGACFTIVAVCYATIRAASQVGTIDIQENEPLVKAEEGEKKDKEEVTEPVPQVDENEPVGYSFSKFHLVFALGAFYIAMLMSDWRTVYHPDQNNATVDSGLAAVWVKIVSSWICIALYVWTLVAPIVLPDRDFS